MTVAAITGDGPNVIETTGLRKRFGTKVAVESLDLQIPRGEIFGLVGPDGAGKTTTFRLLLGLLRPDEGVILLGGNDMRRNPGAGRGIVGYVSQLFSLYWDMSVGENIQFVGEMRCLDRADYTERSRMLLEMTGLAPFTGRLARNLSGGMRQKLALVCALLHRPRVVMLDEPTTGVDPVSRREFWSILYGLPAEGVTLLVSTPYLDEAERCHRLGFMANGRLLALDTPEGFIGRMPDTLVDIRTEARVQARRILKARPEIRRVETVGGTLRVALDPDAPTVRHVRRLAVWLADGGVAVESCEAVEPSLADVFTALSEPQGAQA